MPRNPHTTMSARQRAAMKAAGRLGGLKANAKRSKQQRQAIGKKGGDARVRKAEERKQAQPEREG